MMLADLLDRPIAFHRAFVTLGGGVNGALLLSQAVYWSRRTADGGGWFFKTQTEWTEETGLSRREQEGARRALTASGVLQEDRRGVPARLFYRVDFEVMERALSGAPVQTSLSETANPDCTKPPIKNGGFAQSLKEETTSETTSEIRERGRATRLPDSYHPDTAWAVSEGMTAADASREAERFRDYWSAAPGQRGVKRDWQATWRNWVRNALDRQPAQRRALVPLPREPDGLFALCATISAGEANVIDHE